MADIIADTYKLNQYAQRIVSVNARIVRLNRRLDTLYFKIGLQDLWHLMQADALVGNNWRLKRCEDYLEQTGNDFDWAEKQILIFGQEDFATSGIRQLMQIINAYQERTSGFPGNDPFQSGEAVEVLKNWFQESNFSVREGFLDAFLKSFPDADDFETTGEFFSAIEDLYGQIPREIQGGFNILVNSLLPGSVSSAYSLTSRLLQGELTMDDLYDTASRVALEAESWNTMAFVETIRYTLSTGAKRDAEMKEEVLSRIKKGDVLGAITETAEGYIDIVVAGTVECLFGMGGTILDGTVGELPVLDEGIKYFTGLISGGKEYSAGDLLRLAGKGTGIAVDAATDFVTDTADAIVSGVADGAKSVCSWVSSWFS